MIDDWCVSCSSWFSNPDVFRVREIPPGLPRRAAEQHRVPVELRLAGLLLALPPRRRVHPIWEF